jgi:hypothetical protein
MEIYRAEDPPVIVATDLVARGMDIKNLDLVSHLLESPSTFTFRSSTTACRVISAPTFIGKQNAI